VRDEAELIAVSYSDLAELTFKTDDEIERVNRQSQPPKKEATFR
jgi:hypothetical protein